MSTVNNYILPSEEVKFIATYDVSTRTDNPDNSDIAGVSGLVTEVAGECAFSFIQNTYVYSTTGIPGAPKYIFENYALSTVDIQDRSYVGECVWQASYPDAGSNGITATSIFCFGVSSGTGPYQGLTKVVIDFTNVNRVLYLIGRKSPLGVA